MLENYVKDLMSKYSPELALRELCSPSCVKENIVAVLMTQQLGAGPEWGELQNKFNVAIYQALK